MTKRLICLLAVATLLANGLCLGVFAAPATVSGGTVMAVTAAEDLPATDNLLAGKMPFWGNGGGTDSIVYVDEGEYPYLEGTVGAVRDDKIQGVDVIADEDTVADSALRVAANNGSHNLTGYDRWREQVWISFNLGETKTVDTFLLAHSLLGDLATGTAAGKLAKTVEVRVTNTVAALATADPVMTFSADDLGGMPNVLKMTLDTAVSGQYVGFYITVPGSNTDYFLTAAEKKANYIYLSELGAYNSTPADSTMTVTGATLKPVASAIDLPATENILYGSIPTTGDKSTLLSDSSVLYGGSAAAMVDGKVQGIDVMATEDTVADGMAAVTTVQNAWNTSSDGWGNQVWLVYDLKAATTMDTMIIANSLIGQLADVATSSRYVYKGEIYVADTRAGAVDAANQVVTFDSEGGHHSTPAILRFDLNKAVTGQYVGFHFVLPDEAVVSETGATDTEGYYRYKTARLSELGVYFEAVPYLTTRLNGEEDADKLPTDDNLLAGLPVYDKNGSSLPGGNGEMSQQSSETLAVDGIINGVTCPIPDRTTDATMNKFLYRTYENGPITYDLRGQVTMDRFLVAADAWDTENYWIPKAEIYVGNKLTTLFDSEPVAVANLNGKIAALVTLKEAVTGRYVGFRIPATANVVRIGELGVYGTYQSYMGEVQSLIQGKTPAEDYLCEPGQVDIFNKPEGWLNDLRWDEVAERLTDGDTTTRCGWTIISGDRYPTVQDRWYIQPGTGWSVLVYHLGGTASVESIILTSTHEWGNYFIGGADFYVGQTLKTLFDPANRVYTSGGEKLLSETDPETGEVTYTLDPSTDITERVIRYDLDTPVEGRYVAFVITRPHASTKLGYSIARIDELEVLGNLAADKVEIPPQTTFTDEVTGCTMTVEQLNYDDVDFYDTIGGLKVTTAPWSKDKVVGDNWLRVNSDQYTLTIVDKNGNPMTEADLGGRTLRVTVPGSTDYEQGLGEVLDGQVQRILNSRTVDGTILGNHVAAYPTNIVKLVFNEEPVNGNAYAGTDIYEGGKTAGVQDTVSYGWLALCTLPLLAVLLLLYVRKVKGGAAQ